MHIHACNSLPLRIKNSIPLQAYKKKQAAIFVGIKLNYMYSTCVVTAFTFTLKVSCSFWENETTALYAPMPGKMFLSHQSYTGGNFNLDF